MADATVLKTVEGNLVRVRLPSSAPNPPRLKSGGFFLFFSHRGGKRTHYIADRAIFDTIKKNSHTRVATNVLEEKSQHVLMMSSFCRGRCFAHTNGACIPAPFVYEQYDLRPYWLFGQEHRVDHVDDAIAGCDVGDDDLDGFVQEHLAIFDRNGN